VAASIKALGDGQLPNSKGTLYTTPGATQAAGRVTLVNAGASTRTVNLYVQRTGTSRRVLQKDLSLPAGSIVTSVLLTLEAGDLIEGDASAATEIDYTINGFEVA